MQPRSRWARSLGRCWLMLRFKTALRIIRLCCTLVPRIDYWLGCQIGWIPDAKACDDWMCSLRYLSASRRYIACVCSWWNSACGHAQHMDTSTLTVSPTEPLEVTRPVRSTVAVTAMLLLSGYSLKALSGRSDPNTCCLP